MVEFKKTKTREELKRYVCESFLLTSETNESVSVSKKIENDTFVVYSIDFDIEVSFWSKDITKLEQFVGEKMKSVSTLIAPRKKEKVTRLVLMGDIAIYPNLEQEVMA